MKRFFALILGFAALIVLAVAVRFFFPSWWGHRFPVWLGGQSLIEAPMTPVLSATDQTALEQQILAATPQDEKKLYARAEQFFEHGALSFAEKDLTLLLEKNPQHKEGLLLLVKTHVRSRNFSAAEAVARSGLQKFPNDKDILLLLGDLLVQQGKFPEARQAFDALPADSAERNYFQGVMACVEGKYDDAQALLSKVQGAAEFQKRSEILLGAFQEYALFPDGNPLHRDTLLAKALNDVQMYELSLQLSKKVLEAKSDYRDAWLTNGYSYLALEKYEFAKNAFQKAFEIDPTYAATAYYLGLTLKRLGDLDTALNFFERARKNEFTFPKELLSEIADTYYLQENYDLALKTYEDMLQAAAGQAAEFVRPIYIALTLLKQPDTGIALGNQVVEKYPNEAMSWNLRGWAYLEKGDLEKAEADLEKSVKMDDKLTAAYLNLGKLREQQNRKEDAITYYEKVYTLDPLSELGRTAGERYNALIE